jgi:8-oxo-dGTP pyrophosphatase MutT (NUDIX family)
LAEPSSSVDPRGPYAPQLNYGRHRMPPLPDTRRAAVLVLLYPLPAGWALPLTVRAQNLIRHAGQVSFPGGELDAGETAEEAACRECDEELGLVATRFMPLGRLSPVYVYGSNFLITPCVAASQSRPDFRPNPVEVAGLVELPLTALLDPGNHGEHWIRRRGVRYRAPHLRWQGHRIWGATRLILAELAARLD